MSSFRLGPITLASSWAPLLHPSILALEFPPIPNIDCSQCWMAELGLFRPKVKCCTYNPTLPNFLVGEILEDGWAEGGHSDVGSWIDEGRAGPLMIHVPPKEVERFQREYADPMEQPGCPLLDGDGRCTIYEHRPPLCIGYHCVYPPNPQLIGFWNSLASLLELHTILAAQYLLKRLSFDAERFSRFWAEHDFAEIWRGDGIEESHAQELWQGRQRPDDFYRECYAYVVSHADTLREELEKYRREQLIAGLEEDEGADHSARLREIREQSSTPTAQMPPEDAHKAFMGGHRLLFPQHHWTLSENESYILWYHAQAYGA